MKLAHIQTLATHWIVLKYSEAAELEEKNSIELYQEAKSAISTRKN